MDYRVGFCQYKPELFEVDKNLERLEKMLSGVEADLIVLPELAATGYVINTREELERVAEDVKSGRTVEMFRVLAEKNDTSYIVGFAEREDDRIYNSAFMVNPNGELYIYRKTHLFNREKNIFNPGESGFFVKPAKGGVRVGMMVCFDWIFPESARTLNIQGAEIICHPANLVLPWCQQAMITRSIENRIFTVTANRTGTEKNGEIEMGFTGQSQITDPSGKVIKRLDETEETVWVETIDPEKAKDKWVTEYNHLLKDRRKELYSE
jgi:predicted amidohydrolase